MDSTGTVIEYDPREEDGSYGSYRDFHWAF